MLGQWDMDGREQTEGMAVGGARATLIKEHGGL